MTLLSRTLFAGAAACLGLLTASLPAAADNRGSTAVVNAGERPARFIMGVKFGGGGTLWNQPDETRLSTVDNAPWKLPIFHETRGGYAMSAGFFLEGVFFEHLGLEVGFNFVQHKLLETITWTYTETNIVGGVPSVNSYTAESEQNLQWTALHVPVLIKAVMPSGNTRVSLGVGPEFAFASWARSDFNITSGGVSDGQGGTVLPGSRGALRSVGANLKDSVYLAVVFGVQIAVGDFLIPIDIHWGYNLSQPKRYLDRVDVDPNSIPSAANPGVHPESVTIQTRDSMYGGIRIGFAYQF